METSERPWGRYEVLDRGEGYQVKRIEIGPGKRFSLQKHLKRSERWIFVAGEGVATLGEDTFTVRVGSYLEVALGQVHRIQNTGKTPLVLIEVQQGSYLGEDDIVRFQDDFGRA